MTTAFASMGARVVVWFAAAVFVVAVALVIVVWHVPPAVLKHVADVAGALGPVITFLTVLAAATGWVVTARLNGEEARRTEREKRAVANYAHRDHVRARLHRVWQVIDEAVGVKPYQPDLIEQFIAETEDLYWQAETFSAFSRTEHGTIRDVLDRCRFDNRLASSTIKDDGSGEPPKRPRDIVREWFVSSLESLEVAFRDVFKDEDLSLNIGRRLKTTCEDVERIRELQYRERPGG